MAHRAFSALAIAVLSGSLAACGGGGSTTNTIIVQPTSPPAGSVQVSPGTLNFTGPGAPAQQFTVSSTVSGLAAPAVDPFGCGTVASISPPSSGTLPATYTVTPTGIGTCSFVVRVGNATAALGINVGTTGPSATSSASTVNLFVGGTSGSVAVGSSNGQQWNADTTACTNIASVTSTPLVGGQFNESFTISPISAGTCQIALVNGSASVIVTVIVNPSPSGPSALQISPSTLTFASPSAPPQHATITFTGSVGQVSFDESDCTGGAGGTSKPKIAFFTLDNVPPGTPVSLPASITVTPYGTASGTCVIHFTPQNGTGADLTVTVM